MKSTARLIDNLMSNDFKKCRIDLDHAVKTIMKKRVSEKKKDYIKQINSK
jgi:hypothetical protein